MDIAIEFLKAGVMIGFIVFVIAAIACLFMIVFSAATSIDRSAQE
jgi:flagellar biosynthesis protein FliQ